MKNHLIITIQAILMAMVLAGCTNIKITTSSYREKPIEIDEALTAIKHSGIVGKAWKEKHKIRFEGDGFSGELFHGTEGEAFQRYGLDVSFGYGYSQEECMKVLNELTKELYPQTETTKIGQNQTTHTTSANARLFNNEPLEIHDLRHGGQV